MNNKNVPLFTIFKRENFSKLKAAMIRVGAVLVAFIISLILACTIIKKGPFEIIGTIFEGAFAMPWRLIYDSALLLGFGVAIIPAFRMKFWNMGANGQVLIGCLAAVLVMFYLGSSTSNIPNFLLIILMLIAAILASVIWAVVPAIFKAYFNTNETLFTLMMNYIAIELVAGCNYVMALGKQETPGIINRISKKGWIVLDFLPASIRNYILPIIAIILITVFIYFYMNKTKHGYEVIVLGDSENTAKYVGMDVKKITIRTLVVSGIICGIIGFFLVSSVNHLVTAGMCGSKGFTGVLIAWLSNFNPLIMAGVSFFLSFIESGTSKVTSKYSLGTNDLASVIIGLIFFAILVSEFFIRYRIKINKRKAKDKQEEEVAQC